MLEVSSIEDIKALRESSDVECKLAQGRDGKGKLPNDFWETYSAFANTQGGDVFLGLKEKKNQSFDLAGIEDTQKVINELWTGLNNPQKVSGNILRDRWVKILKIEDKAIIQIHVPQAPRKQKPVFIKGNPLKGTYKRLNSADLLQNEEEVRRMLAEQVEESRDSEILQGYGIDDLELDSFNAYRRLYITLQPDHPWNQNDAQDFLYNIGGWARDREAGYSGLTRAGLLMFGRLRAIKEAFPNYMLDYQERDEARAEARWIDRFTLDGTWSGNVFDFYRQIIRKLTADLKVPFRMEGDQRLDDTLVHKALREALVNVLVHADYTGRASILVVKRPDMFGFRNPGLMRIPLDTAIAGGESDCRNRLLQDMFRFVGLGENAGSGLPKIYQGWSSQHWRDPALREKLEPSEQTLLELHMLSLVPDEVLAELRLSLGSDVFDSLSENERLILVTAHIETTVDHQRMMTVMDVHPRDLTVLFSGLVDKDIIYQEGTGRGTIYFLSEARNNDMVDLLLDDISGGQGVSSGGLEDSSGGLKESSGGLKVLEAIAKVVASKKKSPKSVVETTVLSLCKQQELTLDELANLLNRSNESIRKDYLQPMIKDKRLRYRYPTMPNHPDQAYATNDSEGKV
jgi:predicted HTH transcriptional regulator